MVEREDIQERTAGHFQAILQTREAFGILVSQRLDGADVLGRISAHVTDPHGESVP